jgi:hypothetical protein
VVGHLGPLSHRGNYRIRQKLWLPCSHCRNAVFAQNIAVDSSGPRGRRYCMVPSISNVAIPASVLVLVGCATLVGDFDGRQPGSDAGASSAVGGSSAIGGTDGTSEGGSSEALPSAGGTAGIGGVAGNANVGGSEPIGGSTGSSDAGGDVGPASNSYELQGAPLPFSPTMRGFGLNAVLASGNPATLRAHVRAADTTAWGAMAPPAIRGTDIAQWVFEGLSPGIRFEYEILAPAGSGYLPLYSGSAVTQRQPGEAFTFSLITDSHIGPHADYPNQGDWSVLERVSSEAGAVTPDFMVNLGDMLDFHEIGFNDAPPEAAYTRLAYLNYRTLLGDTLGHTAHYPVIGNWEGEDGFYTAEELERSRSQRLLYMPGPQPTTYPEGGSPTEDYYAFTWGDALFIVLNVMTYTTTAHLLSYYPGLPDDWTLGQAQLRWFADTLAKATSKWRFVLIHHTVGGAAGDTEDSAYGRGGGQAAHVGEQATVHQLMLDHGVQVFFYGHDHVFTDMQVDGIHYTEPGNAGAPWMFTQDLTGYTQSWRAHGWSRVTVSPSAVNVQFIAMGGGVIYEYTL